MTQYDKFGFHADATPIGESSPSTKQPWRPPQLRIVRHDLTIRYQDLTYSIPSASPGDVLTVYLLAGTAIAIAYADGRFAGTSASADRFRNHLGRHRATSRPTHSGRSTSAGKTLAQNPLRSLVAHPAMPPVRLRRHTTDTVDAAAAAIFHPIPDLAYSPEPVPGTRYSKSGSGK